MRVYDYYSFKEIEDEFTNLDVFKTKIREVLKEGEKDFEYRIYEHPDYPGGGVVAMTPGLWDEALYAKRLSDLVEEVL